MLVSVNGIPCSRIAVCSHNFLQVEMLQDQVCELHKKTEDQRELSNRRAMQQQETLAHLSNTLTEKRSSADSVERKLQEYRITLDNLLHGIDNIFHIVRCDDAPILSLLGECN
jgi:predicted RNase H-like nuclease (RuvC/YqgF family)